MKFNSIKASSIYRLMTLGRKSLFFMVMSAFVGSIVEGMTLSFFIPILFGGPDKLIEMKGRVGDVFKFLRDMGLFSSTEKILFTLVLATVLRGAIEFLRLYYQSQVSFDIGERIRMKALKGLGETEYVKFLQFTKGDLVNFFNTEISGCINGLSKLAQSIALLFSSVALIIISFNLNSMFTVAAITIAALLSLFFKNTNRWLIHFSRDNSQKSGEFHGLLLQGLTYFKYLISTERFKTFEARIVESLNRLLKNKRQYSLRSAFISSIQEPIAILCLVGVIILETRMNGTPLSSLMVSLLVFYRVMKTLNALQISWQSYLVTTGSTEIVLNVLDQFEEFKVNKNTELASHGFKDSIEFKNVSLSLSSSRILNNLNLSFKKYQTIAIVGESGAGKSTIVDLLTGLLKPSEGTVMVDGDSLQDVNLNAWRSSIGLVTQEPVCFSGSVRENVVFWQPVANDERLAKVIRQSGSHEFVTARSQGVDSSMGDSGVSFSGGQRQRIAISRELYREPDLLILDEATSALDAENEDIIQTSLVSMKGKLTIVMVTHRLASVRTADKIFVIEKGAVIQEGTFKELFAQTGQRFQLLCQRQGVQPL